MCMGTAKVCCPLLLYLNRLLRYCNNIQHTLAVPLTMWGTNLRQPHLDLCPLYSEMMPRLQRRKLRCTRDEAYIFSTHSPKKARKRRKGSKQLQKMRRKMTLRKVNICHPNAVKVCTSLSVKDNMVIL